MVDFPQPEGPRSATTSPARTSTETSLSTSSRWPEGSVNWWVTPTISQMAARRRRAPRAAGLVRDGSRAGLGPWRPFPAQAV